MTTFLARITGSGAGRVRPDGGASAAVGPARPLGQWAFAGVAVAALGGPLALAAPLPRPGRADDGVPEAEWLRTLGT